MVNQFFWQSIWKLLELTSTNVWENCRGLNSGSLIGGTVSLPENAMGKQNYRRVIILRLDLLEPYRSSDSFLLNAYLEIGLVSFLLVEGPEFDWFFSGLLCSTELFHKVRGWCFYKFFLLNSAEGLPVKTMFAEFKKPFSSYTFCLLGRGFKVLPKSGSLASVSVCVMISPELQKTEHVTTWLLSFSLVEIQ